MVATEPILEVEGLSVAFTQYGRGLRQRSLKVISDLSLSAAAGTMVAVVGASGSGKSLLAHAILGLLPVNAQVEGSIRFKGKEMDEARRKELRGVKIAFVPQTVESLDPLMKVGPQVRGVKGSVERQRRLFERYELSESVDDMYPFELSGGMARRVLVSTAAMRDAELIVADEPTPGLTHAMALEAMRMFRSFADEGKAVVVITHELDLAYEVADQVVVFYAGTTLEVADAKDFRKGGEGLRHPFSKALWRALPQNGFAPTPGTQPYADALPEGCHYASRCPIKTKECMAQSAISLRDVRGGKVRCIHAS